MKHIKVLLAFALLLSVTLPLQAQKFLKKELKIENEELITRDGFEFRWYRYSYLQGHDTLYAAFSLNGERITPPSDYIDKGKHSGDSPWYCGGGIFMCKLKKTNTFSDNICVGYNLRGQKLFPESLEATHIIHWGDGKFTLMHKTDYGRKIYSAYDVKGNCLIPSELEYNFIGYYSKGKCFWCYYKDTSGKETACFTYTDDGIYFAEGKYNSEGHYDPTGHYNLSNPEERAIFEKHKKTNPYISNGTNNHTQPQQLDQQQSDQRSDQKQRPTPPPPPQPMQVWVPCGVCNGSGQCHICGGLGWKYTTYDPHATCTICGGNGKCNQCAGHGGHNEIQYR